MKKKLQQYNFKLIFTVFLKNFKLGTRTRIPIYNFSMYIA